MTFTAQAPALGFLYQVRFALYLLLTADREESELAIEKLDDISFEEGGDPLELIQTKHHVNRQASLTNASPDLWKSIRVWSNELLKGYFSEDLILTLVTTSAAPETGDSIAKKIQDGVSRNNKVIARDLVKVAEESSNAELKPAFEDFLKLSELQREQLVKSIQILDKSLTIYDLPAKIKMKLQVQSEHRDAAYMRLEGWWVNRVIEHLKSNEKNTIKYLELMSKIADINAQFRTDNLPIDYANSEPLDQPDAASDQRQFVNQLRIIGLQNPQIETAIRDYYRAFTQRSVWQRDQLLNINELEDYEKKLVDEWQRQSHWHNQEGSETELINSGKDLFKWAEQADIRIRTQVTEPYVMRGSFHILADASPPRVGWHPKFIDRLQSLLNISEFEGPHSNRPFEVQNLFNPAFCAYLLHIAIKSYNTERNQGIPYALLFLILPVVLHKETRNTLPRKVNSKFHTWLRNHPSSLVGFSQRTKDLVKITKEALFFGMNQGYISISKDDLFTTTDKSFNRAIENGVAYDKTEINEIEGKSKFVGRWYSQSGKVSSMYVMLGIRP